VRNLSRPATYRLCQSLRTCAASKGVSDALRFAISDSRAWASFLITALLFPDAREFEETQKASVTGTRGFKLLTSESASEVVTVVATEWAVRQEVVDVWKRSGNMIQ